MWNNFRRGTNKFGARKVEYQGVKFDSTVERDRYLYLREMQKRGEISGLRLQVRFLIIPKLTRIVPKQLKTKVRYDERTIELPAYYTCDFLYKEKGVYVIEDTKSEYGRSSIRDYPLRRKLMVHKIYEHNKKNHGQWIFRESVLCGNKLKIIDI